MVGGASAVILVGGFAAAPQPTAKETDGLAESDADGTTTGEPSPAAEASEREQGADAAVTGTFDGPVVSNIRGDYQVQLTFEAGVLVAVDYPVAGTEAAESRRVNDMALPILEEEFLEAQDWDVEHVSGASYTSPAMIESAQGAFEDAGL